MKRVVNCTVYNLCPLTCRREIIVIFGESFMQALPLNLANYERVAYHFWLSLSLNFREFYPRKQE